VFEVDYIKEDGISNSSTRPLGLKAKMGAKREEKREGVGCADGERKALK